MFISKFSDLGQITHFSRLIYAPCSKCYHSLVQLVMGSDCGSDMASKEQARSILNEVLDLLDTKAKVICSMCALHAISKFGIKFFRRVSLKWRFCGY